MLKQNRLFSSVYIVGTGLSIALVMVLFVIYYVRPDRFIRNTTGTACW